jgi:hypothetical protein
MTKRPRIGDRVIIAFGRPDNEIEVEIYRIDGTGKQTRFTVELYPDNPYEIEARRQGEPWLTLCRPEAILRAA